MKSALSPERPLRAHRRGVYPLLLIQGAVNKPKSENNHFSFTFSLPHEGT